nr:MAG TPA: hypothetical protein [Caudoviricetes sp.]
MGTWYPGCVTCDTRGFRGLKGECKAGSIPVPRATRP